MKKRCFIILCALFMLITGCSKSDKEAPKSTEEALKGSLDVQFEMASQVSGEKSDPAYLTKMEELSDYEVISYEERDGIIDAVVLVTAPDLYSVVKELDKKGKMSEEETTKALVKEIKKADMVETEVELQFENVDGQWTPILTSEFLDAYYGGVVRLRSEYYSELVEGGEQFE